MSEWHWQIECLACGGQRFAVEVIAHQIHYLDTQGCHIDFGYYWGERYNWQSLICTTCKGRNIKRKRVRGPAHGGAEKDKP